MSESSGDRAEDATDSGVLLDPQESRVQSSAIATGVACRPEDAAESQLRKKRRAEYGTRTREWEGRSRK